MADNDKDKVVKTKEKKEKGEKRHFTRVRETVAELKKVTWPTFGNIVKTTGLVLGIVAIFLLVVLAFDLILSNFAYKPLTDGTFPWSKITSALSVNVSKLANAGVFKNIWRL